MNNKPRSSRTPCQINQAPQISARAATTNNTTDFAMILPKAIDPGEELQIHSVPRESWYRVASAATIRARSMRVAS
jgi:hypothetical protein